MKAEAKIFKNDYISFEETLLLSLLLFKRMRSSQRNEATIHKLQTINPLTFTRYKPTKITTPQIQEFRELSK